MTVLIIDDDKDFSEFLSGYISSHLRLRVDTASNGVDGLELIKKTRPNIVILDLHMPGINGTEVLKEIVASKIKVKVIIVSGHMEDYLTKNKELLKKAILLRKPFDLEVLNKIFEEAGINK